MASGEIAQRLLPIHLGARSANPQERTDFPHPDPITYARSRRREIHGAIAGLVEHWKEADKAPFTTVPFGGFEGWTQVVGGILGEAGSVNFLGNLRAWQVTVDDFSADASTLLADWCREELLASGERLSAPVQAKAIRERAERLDLFAQFRQGHTPAAVASMFGKRVLAVIVDRVFDARVQVGDQQEVHEVALRHASSGSTSLYRLEDLRTLQPPAGPAPSL